MLNTPGFSSKKLDIEQPGVETFQRSFPQDSGKFCTLFNSLRLPTAQELAKEPARKASPTLVQA
jgi:hypothetical protein